MSKQEDSRPRQGYLLLADISGYTEFLTGTELEHAQEIIRELTAVIRVGLTPPMRFVKREGDAVFCYANAEVFRDGERFVELIEACYFNFCNRLDDMARSTICRCDACAAIGSLGLKFVAHYGTFIVEREGAGEDLAGPDVILVHRLLKNSIRGDGGPTAYAFLTDASLGRMPSSFSLPKHSEVYESFGRVVGGVHDLVPVLTAMRDRGRHVVTEDAADFRMTIDVPLTPSIAWQYIVDPIERLRWVCDVNSLWWPQFGTGPDSLDRNASGRTGVGAKTHCGHAPKGITAMREFIDWRPFSYFTFRTSSIFDSASTETWEFESRGEYGTRISVRSRLTAGRRVAHLAWRMFKPLYAARMRRAGALLQRIIEEDAATLGIGGSGSSLAR